MSHFIPGLACLLALGACATDPISGESKLAIVNWSIEDEQSIGDATAPTLIAEMDGPYADASVQESLAAIVQEMVTHSPRAGDFDFTFRVLNSSEPNALALPGGRIFITRGLLARLHNEAEFVGVLGHELGHAEHQHSLESLNKGILLGAPTAPLRAASNIPLVGGLLGSAASVADAPSTLLGLSFNRSQELEADERAVYFTDAMGYNPRALIGVFDTLEQVKAEAPGGATSGLSIFSTHPLGKDRIRCVNEKANALPTRTQSRQDSPEFAAVLKRFQSEAEAFKIYDGVRSQFRALAESLDSSEPDPQAEAQFGAAVQGLATALEMLPDEPLFHIQAAELAMLLGDAATAELHLEQAESRYAAETPGEGHWKPPLYLGLLRLSQGENDAAVTSLEVAVERFPANTDIQEALAAARQAAESTAE